MTLPSGAATVPSMLPPDADFAATWSRVSGALVDPACCTEEAAAIPDAEGRGTEDDWTRTDCASAPEASVPANKAAKIRRLVFRNMRIRSTYEFLHSIAGISVGKTTLPYINSLQNVIESKLARVTETLFKRRKIHPAIEIRPIMSYIYLYATKSQLGWVC